MPGSFDTLLSCLYRSLVFCFLRMCVFSSSLPSSLWTERPTQGPFPMELGSERVSTGTLWVAGVQLL